MGRSVAELMRYRYLFEQMVRRELRQKYKGSALGLLWYLVNPLVLMAAYSVMFTYVLKRPFKVHDYAMFVLVGIVVWMFFSQSLTAGATALLDQGALVRKAVFPRETIPAAVVTVQLVTFCMLLALIAPVVFLIHGSLSLSLVLLPVYVALLFLFSLGLALAVSVLHAYFRDVAPILTAVLLPWFFFTPIFFPPTGFPGSHGHHWVQPLVQWANPAAPYVDSIRTIVFDGRLPGLDTTAYVAVGAALGMAVGVSLFRRMQSELAVVV